MRISDWSSDVCSSDLTGPGLQSQRCLAGPLCPKNHAWYTVAPCGVVAAFFPCICAGDPGRAGLDHESATFDSAVFGEWQLGAPACPRLGGRTPLLAALAGQFVGHGRPDRVGAGGSPRFGRSDEHTSELQSLMRISYAVFCLKK